MKDIVNLLKEFDKVLFVEPQLISDRALYAKSPFRRKDMKDRLNEEIPEDLDLLAFAFPEDNYEGSSHSEEEAKGYQLNIKNLKKKETMISSLQSDGSPLKLQMKSDMPISGISLKRGISEKVLEPSSALLKQHIKKMGTGVKQLADAEIMQYQTSVKKIATKGSKCSLTSSNSSDNF